MSTALADKLERAGAVQREVRFTAALAEFLNNGGTLERAYALLDAVAEKMGSEAKTPTPQGRARLASASLPNESVGQIASAHRAVETLPSLSTESSEGQTRCADKAGGPVP